MTISLLAMPAAHADGGSLEKAYFAATTPGAWAKYESSWEMPDGKAGTNIYTYIRASDDADRVRIELCTETLSGPGEGMTTRQLFVMEPGFDLARDFMNRMMYLEASAAQTGDGTTTLIPDNVIEIMRSSAGDMTKSVTLSGSRTIEGHDCDHYTYSYRLGGPHSTLQEGEICLDETVPFGLVSQTGRTIDDEGVTVSSFEQKLVASGTGQTASAALLAMTPATASAAPESAAPGALPSLPFTEAYLTGTIRLFVQVVEGSGGRRLDITALSQADEPFELVVPAGMLTIPAGSPIGDLNILVNENLELPLAPGESSPPISTGQPGERGATGGSFQLTVHEGEPLYQGTVEVGPLN
jgi:hypothetical protein